MITMPSGAWAAIPSTTSGSRSSMSPPSRGRWSRQHTAYSSATPSARPTARRSGQPGGGQPRLGHVQRVLAVGLHLAVEIDQDVRVELRRYLVEHGNSLRREIALVRQRNHVLETEEVLRVLENDELVRLDRGVRRENVPDLDVVSLEGRDRQRTARVQRLEGLEFEAVLGLEARQSLGTGLELGRPADDQVG